MRRGRHGKYVSHAGTPLARWQVENMALTMGDVVEMLVTEGEERGLPLYWRLSDYWALWMFYLSQLG